MTLTDFINLCQKRTLKYISLKNTSFLKGQPFAEIFLSDLISFDFFLKISFYLFSFLFVQVQNVTYT